MVHNADQKIQEAIDRSEGQESFEGADYIFDAAGINSKGFSEKHTPDARFVDIEKEDVKVRKWAIETGKIFQDSTGQFQPVVKSEVKEGLLTLYQDMNGYDKNLVLEVSDSKFRFRQPRVDISSPIAEFQDVAYGKFTPEGKVILETADDDRVIGIPYTIANIGADRYYVINGRVYSGWAMWFGLQAIRAPEDYARNVDLTYNLPFVWSAFQLKAQLSLGSSFELTHGSEEDETPEEAFLKEVFNSKLNINVNKLAKTSMHIDMYGNAYWHIRRDMRGFPDKITILQPERLKVFLDPKTTRVLYYIYLPPVLAGMSLTPYPNIRENPNILHGPALTYPTPIILDPQDVLHFKENDFTEYPYGLSSCKAMLDPATARMDINVIAPMIFKRYAKPLIHWKLDPMTPTTLTKGQIEGYINGMKETLQNMEPMSDPITSTRWSADVIGAAQGKAELLTILQDLDNQIFACTGVPESYFKPQGTGDRMIAEQDKTFMAAMQLRQQMVGEKIQEKLVKEVIDRYDRILSQEMIASGLEPLPQRPWNGYPTIQWRETFKQDQAITIQNTMALLQAGIIDHSRAARRVGEMPPQQSVELARRMDLDKITQEVQLAQSQLQMMQTQLQMLDTQQVMEMGGTMAAQFAQQQAQAQLAMGADPAEGEKQQKKTKKGGKSKTESDIDNIDENQRFRVTFLNRTGKRQTETMKGSTLRDRKMSGLSIENIEPVGQAPDSPAQKDAGESIGR
jgi:hypothetical protein